ncbi:MerR family transcriptional regulator [Nocardia concava]|uniref:MerR family transcriptional regulator n=1 Tax=Nocardia concava TaxID=257281 RepID=UPI0002F8980D|nr:MerR family transcriptional regulator [Nocardia concava]
MNVTHGIRPRGWIGIGELSRRTGVPVRTIRFYCDEGVLESGRSSGGHRAFDPVAAVDRLALVRRLRGLGLGLGAIAEVLGGSRSVAEAAAAERRAVEAELGELTRRREVLRAVTDPGRAHREVTAFWSRILEPLPAELFDAFLEMNAPAPTDEPDPRRLLAYGELVGMISEPGLSAAMSRLLWRSDPAGVRHPRALLTGVAEACESVGGLLVANEPPRAGAELDRFVAAHARARGVRDTAGLRRRLLSGATDSDERVQRYWSLTAEITGTVTTGAAHYWLYEALTRSA